LTAGTAPRQVSSTLIKVSSLVANLLSEEVTISLVAETEGIVVGHVAFSPVTIDNNESFQGYILAPLEVIPVFRRCSRTSNSTPSTSILQTT